MCTEIDRLVSMSARFDAPGGLDLRAWNRPTMPSFRDLSSSGFLNSLRNFFLAENRRMAGSAVFCVPLL